MKFYDEHAEQRDQFEILAFHDATAKSLAELDQKLTSQKTIEKVWKGKHLPFPILIDSTGQTIKEWDIHAFPTLVLIDPDGKVVRGGGEKMLRDKLAEGRAQRP